MNKVATFQIGKNGITPTVLQTLTRMLETHKFIRIAALQASGRNRESIKAMADSLIHQLPVKCTYTIIGFTIILRKRTSTDDKSRT